MKTKIMRLVVAAAFAIGFGKAYAFHDGGVAECSGCHSMHSPIDTTGFLLIGLDQSSTCLSCHGAGSTTSSYHVMTNPLPATGLPQQYTPGGDFAYLTKTYTWLGRGTPAPTVTEAGQTHGHNIIAAGFGLGVDTDNPTAPGGTYPSSQLGCQSCHDPHSALRRTGTDAAPVWATSGAPIAASGSYATSPVIGSGNYVGVALGTYRLLRGGGNTYPNVTYNTIALAIAPGTYNQSEGTNQVRVAYGSSGTSTWGQWCGSCHPGMHTAPLAGGSNYVHPIDANLNAVATNYNNYVSSGIFSGNANPYLSLVSFAENTGDLSILKTHASNTNTFLAGPATTDKVMCLSCHRAHASGFQEMTRWNLEYELLTTQVAGVAKYPGSDGITTSGSFHMGRTQADWQNSYYNRDPAKLTSSAVAVGYQRSLCNKCHAKD
jgi:hypothetical protein